MCSFACVAASAKEAPEGIGNMINSHERCCVGRDGNLHGGKPASAGACFTGDCRSHVMWKRYLKYIFNRLSGYPLFKMFSASPAARRWLISTPTRQVTVNRRYAASDSVFRAKNNLSLVLYITQINIPTSCSVGQLHNYTLNCLGPRSLYC